MIDAGGHCSKLCGAGAWERACWRRRSLDVDIRRLFLRLATSHLLGLEVLIEQVQGLLVGTGAAGDGEHALASVIMRGLGDGNAGAGRFTDLTNLAATAPDNAANHVGGNADILRLQLNTILVVRGRWRPARSIGPRSTGEGGGRRVAKVCAVTRAVVRASTTETASGATVGQRSGPSAWLNPDGGVVKNGSVAALVIVNETLANLPDGLLDAGWGALYLDDALGRLGQHLLLCNHAHARRVLDLLDLQALASDNGAHLVVRDEQTDGWEN